MADKPSVKELSFRRPRHEVDLVEGAVRDGRPCVLCVAKDKSKVFIAVKLVELWSRKCREGKKCVLLTENPEGE